MSARYWVGGNAAWDATAGTKWATTSGGAGDAAVPTSADDVFFDANSGAVTVTVSAVASCNNLTFTGFTGTFAGTFAVGVSGNVTVGSGMTWTHSGALQINGTCAFTSNGKSITSSIATNTASTNLSLSDALNTSAAINVNFGTFTTNNFSVTATSLSSSNSNTRTINLGSSTVTLSSTGSAINLASITNLTFNASTSTINLTSISSPNLTSGGLTFYNVSFTGANPSNCVVAGANTFNNLSFSGRTTAGITNATFSANQTINGTLTLSAGTNATMRTFVRSDTIGTTRTLTVNSFAAGSADIDFRDITIAGAAAPVSGTRLGDCKGNSGITFDAGKTVWCRDTAAVWSAVTAWSLTNGGTRTTAAFPLAQDTVVFPSSPTPYPSSGLTITVNFNYNIGTIDMSARTSNTMTLATGTTTPTIYGNWINGTGTTLTGTNTLTFAGRGSQTITSAGKTFTQPLEVNTPGGSVTLQGAFTSSNNLTLTAGTFSLGGYTATYTNIGTSNGNVRTLDVGVGSLVMTGAGFAANTATNLTVTGTGTINLTSASAKTFAGGGIQTYPTINQGGTGALTITGSNKFARMTNTAIGSVLFTGGTTNEFTTSFSLNGAAGTPLTLGSTTTTQAILKKPTSWQMGLLSTNAGNNTGLTFLASDGTMEYLSVSYINGQVTYTGNFFAFF